MMNLLSDLKTSRYQIVSTDPVVVSQNDFELEVPSRYGLGYRHVQMLVIFLCMLSQYIARNHIGVTIVAMTTSHKSDGTNRSVDNNRLFIENTTDTEYFGMRTAAGEEWNIYRTYNWTKPVQEVVLMSFILGYAVMMFPFGFICQRWGGKVPLLIGLVVNVLTSIPVPWLCVLGGWKALAACRFLQGMAQSGLTPAAHTLLGQWVPVSERGRLTNYVYTGTSLGTVIAFQLSGGLASSSWGWPSTFWITGLLSLILLILISLLIAPTPADHKYISLEEKNYILGRVDRGVKKRVKFPWKAIATSKHVWAVVGSHVATGVCSIFCSLQVPSYLHHVLGVNIKRSGLLASLPYIFTTIAMPGFGMLSDFLTNRNVLSLRAARILFNSIGEGGIALCLAIFPFLTDVTSATICFVLSISLFSAVHSGGMLSYIDMAPNLSGSLLAVGSTITNIVLLIVPIIVSHVITDIENQYQWRIVFLVIAGLGITGSVNYILFSTSDKQPWNENGFENADEIEDEEAATINSVVDKRVEE